MAHLAVRRRADCAQTRTVESRAVRVEAGRDNAERLALIAPGRAWAVDLKALTSSEGATLMSVARTIAPHDRLDDAAYALVVQAVDGDAGKNADTRKMIKEGLAALGADFAASSAIEYFAKNSAPMRFFAFKDPEQQTKDQIEMVRSHPWISKEVPVRGFIFDVNTGRLREVLAHAEAWTLASQRFLLSGGAMAREYVRIYRRLIEAGDEERACFAA